MLIIPAWNSLPWTLLIHCTQPFLARSPAIVFIVKLHPPNTYHVVNLPTYQPITSYWEIINTSLLYSRLWVVPQYVVPLRVIHAAGQHFHNYQPGWNRIMNYVCDIITFWHNRTHTQELTGDIRYGGINVSNGEGHSAKFVDLEDDSLMLETLKAQIGNGAIGLCNSFSGSYRSVGVKNRALLPQKSGWGN